MQILNDSSFNEFIAKSQKPVLVDFFAPWCGPCQMLGPILEEVAKEVAETVEVVKVNIDDSPNTANKFSVQSVPAMMLFKNGKMVKEISGLQSKEFILDWIKT